MKKVLWLLLLSAGSLFGQGTPTNHYEVLKQSRWFATSGGIANTITPEGAAVAAISKETNAAQTFASLLKEERPAQQLYGLLGLQAADAKAFESALPGYLERKDKVQVLRGCIAGEWEVGEVARQIKDKQWVLPSRDPRREP